MHAIVSRCIKTELKKFFKTTTTTKNNNYGTYCLPLHHVTMICMYRKYSKIKGIWNTLPRSTCTPTSIDSWRIDPHIIAVSFTITIGTVGTIDPRHMQPAWKIKTLSDYKQQQQQKTKKTRKQAQTKQRHANRHHLRVLILVHLFKHCRSGCLSCFTATNARTSVWLVKNDQSDHAKCLPWQRLGGIRRWWVEQCSVPKIRFDESW